MSPCRRWPLSRLHFPESLSAVCVFVGSPPSSSSPRWTVEERVDVLLCVGHVQHATCGLGVHAADPGVSCCSGGRCRNSRKGRLLQDQRWVQSAGKGPGRDGDCSGSCAEDFKFKMTQKQQKRFKVIRAGFAGLILCYTSTVVINELLETYCFYQTDSVINQCQQKSWFCTKCATKANL